MDAAQPGFAAAVMGGDAPLIQIYTSGTTGNPKGVVVPIRALAAFQAYTEFGFDLRDDDVFWCDDGGAWSGTRHQFCRRADGLSRASQCGRLTAKRSCLAMRLERRRTVDTGSERLGQGGARRSGP
jgi:hypothetical protein